MAKSAARKYVYSFGGSKADGDSSMKNLLGGKGANLAEMCKLRLPVPAGFTVSTECCVDFFANKSKFPASLKQEVALALAATEKEMGMKFGDTEKPLLLSCRSGARQSMPGMMETVLNIGLSPATIPALIKRTGNARFVYDSYRRLIMMYSDVVMEKAEGIEPKDDMGIRKQLDRMMDQLKKKKGYKSDVDMTEADLRELCDLFKARVKEVFGKAFPDGAEDQLWGGIGAVFKSWNGKRAISYRRIEGIPDEWGTAVTVQAMVFGNLGDTSATGVAFTRNPATGDPRFYGEWLANAQGEDVVAGTRTPHPINEAMKTEGTQHLESLEKAMPAVYRQLDTIRTRLEKHYRDMQDLEFTIQDGVLYLLQTRTGKRTGTAALNMAMDMLEEGMINEKEAVLRVKPAQLDEMLHPILDPAAEKSATQLARGLPAGPGGAVGQIVFTAEKAVEWAKAGKTVLLVREETSPEDVEGMRVARGILTARGGMTSHAALVARGWGKCCIVGAGALHVDAAARKLAADGQTLKEGDWASLNGTRGIVYKGAVKLIDATENPRFQKFMTSVDKFRKMDVRANADTPEDARVARQFGAEGIGLFRTEHMFYGKGSDEPLFLLRKMILSKTPDERKKALSKLFRFVKSDIKATLAVMDGLPVTIRLLDPPLHEFVPNDPAKQKELAGSIGITVKEVRERAEQLHESNPMMGHRGVRLGITYPEVAEMQFRAIFEAAAELITQKKQCKPEIMIPVTCDVAELKHQRAICDRVNREVAVKYNLKALAYLFGTMIEIPRAALLADRMASEAEFFSFGTNDLTQMTFGFSRDDTDKFMEDYKSKNILPADPFQTLDLDGVGEMVKIATERGRSARKNLKIGICGEQGGDAATVEFCYKTGLNYVSCSAFRIPLARLAAAQAALKSEKK
ncbi:MAG: pyruvate, phosphate dikinase [Kiritimatiellia bacterium]